MESTDSQQTPASHKWLEITLIFIVFFVAGGAPVPHVNETHYLAKAKQYWQPDWCEGDFVPRIRQGTPDVLLDNRRAQQVAGAAHSRMGPVVSSHGSLWRSAGSGLAAQLSASPFAP